jgi:PAS domain S-box-containing protein
VLKINRLGKMFLSDWRGYLVAVGAVALASFLKYLAQPNVIPADVPILYLLAIVPTAIFFGLGSAILVCILSLLAYDYFFIPPLYTLGPRTVSDAPILLIFLFVGVLFSLLASNLRQKNILARREISARQKSEAELVEYKHHLEDQVKQRTTSLEKANLDLEAEIAEHKKTEEALKESESKANAMIEYAPTAIFEFDYRGPRFLSVNNAVSSLSGYSREELLGINPLDLMDGDNRELFAERIKRQLAGEKIDDFVDYRIKKKNGSIAYFTFQVTLLKDNPHIAFVIGHDITQRRKTEQEILRINRQLRAISDCNQAIVRATDEQVLSTSVCRILCEVVGYRMAWVGRIEHDEAKSVLPVAWFGEDNGYLASANITWADTERGRGPTGIAARTGKTDFCQNFLTESKATPWREEALKRGFRSSIAIPLHIGNGLVSAILTLYAGEPYGFTAAEVELLEELAGDLVFGIEALRTKKDRDRAEEELKNYAAGVENANKELETANQELEAFSYSVSHDLRAPLRGINGFSAALLEEYADKLDDRGREYLNNVRESSQTMGQLIDDLLNLSRINRVEMSVGEVDLSEIVSLIAEDLKKSQPDRKAEFVISSGVTVVADSNLIISMLRNLFENAWKFTGKRELTQIEFGVLKDRTPQVYYVKDNGIGFDMRYSDKLFRPFSRLHSQNEYSGTGIGLANVQRIINRHGGKVWAEGEVNKGATFYFTFEK